MGEPTTTPANPRRRPYNQHNEFFFVCLSGCSPVESPTDAANKWNAFRMESAAGCSEIGNGGIVVNQRGEWMGRVSYNGRVWFSKDEMTSFDNFLLAQFKRQPKRVLS